MYEIYRETKERESEHYRRQMHWIAFPGNVTYSNQNFLTFQQMLQLPFSGWVNLGIMCGALMQFWQQTVCRTGTDWHHPPQYSMPQDGNCSNSPNTKTSLLNYVA